MSFRNVIFAKPFFDHTLKKPKCYNIHAYIFWHFIHSSLLVKITFNNPFSFGSIKKTVLLVDFLHLFSFTHHSFLWKDKKILIICRMHWLKFTSIEHFMASLSQSLLDAQSDSHKCFFSTWAASLFPFVIQVASATETDRYYSFNYL